MQLLLVFHLMQESRLYKLVQKREFWRTAQGWNDVLVFAEVGMSDSSLYFYLCSRLQLPPFTLNDNYVGNFVFGFLNLILSACCLGLRGGSSYEMSNESTHCPFRRWYIICSEVTFAVWSCISPSSTFTGIYLNCLPV